jgi:hypothetical protein
MVGSKNGAFKSEPTLPACLQSSIQVANIYREIDQNL